MNLETSYNRLPENARKLLRSAARRMADRYRKKPDYHSYYAELSLVECGELFGMPNIYLEYENVCEEVGDVATVINRVADLNNDMSSIGYRDGNLHITLSNSLVKFILEKVVDNEKP